MLKAILYLAPLTFFPFFAQAQLTVSNEIYEHDNLGGNYSAELTNNYDEAISRVDFTLLAYSPDRAVPWVEKNYTSPIPGGIEPGEVYQLRGNGPSELYRAQDHEVKVELKILRAYDVDGNEIK